jgi:hypothetical protein
MKTQEQTEEALLEYKISVMQGCLDGKGVQYRRRNSHGWNAAIRFPSWDWSHLDYRLKPEKPARVQRWIVIAPSYTDAAFKTEREALFYVDSLDPVGSKLAKIVHLIETEDQQGN